MRSRLVGMAILALAMTSCATIPTPQNASDAVLMLTNLTGHPCVVVPNGFTDKGTPTSITFTGRLYDEATVLAVALAYERATDFHRKHPPLFQ